MVVEDGTGVVNANSFNTLIEARAYASDRGYSLPSNDSDLETLLVQAADIIELKPFKGQRSTTTQGLSFPRKNLYVEGVLLSEAAVPKKVKHSHIEFAVALHAGHNPAATIKASSKVVEKQVDVIRIKYSESNNQQAYISKAESLLMDFIDYSSRYQLVRC